MDDGPRKMLIYLVSHRKDLEPHSLKPTGLFYVPDYFDIYWGFTLCLNSLIPMEVSSESDKFYTYGGFPLCLPSLIPIGVSSVTIGGFLCT